MTYDATPCILVKKIALRPTQGALWEGCPHGTGLHHARRSFADIPLTRDADTVAPPVIETGWDGVCKDCGAPVDWETANGYATNEPVWNTRSGRLIPGAMYHDPCPGQKYGDECRYWDNCPGVHLHVILPNGHPWDIDSRAGNCDRPNDRMHRCWVRTGEPPLVTAGKGGNSYGAGGGLSCTAGAGSIAAGDYHGFLQDGILTAG